MYYINGQKHEQFKYSVDLATCSHLEGEFWGWYAVSSLLASEDIAFQNMLILWNNLLKQRNFFYVSLMVKTVFYVLNQVYSF